MAIDVIAKLKETHPQATLTMAGPDKGLENHIKNLVNEKDLNESVKFSGFLSLSQKIKEFSANDIYINTNRIDNMPVSVLEARAMGLPVVATDVGGLPYLIKNGEDGFLVANEDVTAMVEKIKILLNDPVLTQKISQKGRMISECSSEISVFTKWKDLIEKILERSVENKKSNQLQKITLVSENLKN